MPHDFTGLPLDSNGWTDYETMVATDAYSAARVVFVSSVDGSDGTGQVYSRSALEFDSDGSFQPTGSVDSYATIEAGMAQMRSGFPDILLLKRGDTWTDQSFAGDSSLKAGSNLLARSIISSYGTIEARPEVLTGLGDAIVASNRKFTIVSGIRFFANDWEDYVHGEPDTVRVGRSYNAQSNSQHQLIEDCEFERYFGARVEASSASYVAFRRNIWRDGNAHDGFMFIGGRSKWICVEQNLFYRPRTHSWTPGGRTIYTSPGGSGNKDHHECAWIRDNTIYQSSGRTAFSYRTSGPFTANLMIESDFSNFGGAGGSEDAKNHVSVLNNVYADTVRSGTTIILTVTNQEGVDEGVWPDNAVKSNLILPVGNVTGSLIGIGIGGDNLVRVCRDMEISGNVLYDIKGSGSTNRGIQFSATLDDVENVVVQNNDIQMLSGGRITELLGASPTGVTVSGHRYFTSDSSGYFNPGSDYAGWLTATSEAGSSFAEVSYTDDTRRPSNYLTYETNEELIDDCLAQSRFNWNPDITANAINAWLQEGFDITPAALPGPPPDPSIGNVPDTPEGKVALRQEKTQIENSTINSVTVELLSGPIAFSHLLLVLCVQNGPGNVTPPDGWDLVADVGEGSSVARLIIWEKILGEDVSEEPLSYTVTWDGSARRASLYIAEYVAVGSRKATIATATTGATQTDSLTIGPTASLDGSNYVALAFAGASTRADAEPIGGATFGGGFDIRNGQDAASSVAIWLGRSDLDSADAVSASFALDATSGDTRLSGVILIFEGASLVAGGVSGERFDDVVLLTSDPAIGGSPPYTYQWHRSTTQGFTPSEETEIDGATELELEDTGLSPTVTYYYRGAVTDDDAAVAYSNEVEMLRTEVPQTHFKRSFGAGINLGV